MKNGDELRHLVVDMATAEVMKWKKEGTDLNYGELMVGRKRVWLFSDGSQLPG